MGLGSRVRPLLALCLIILSAPVCADEKLGGQPQLCYGKKWAIVVGINYSGRADLEATGTGPLENAESDATAVSETLVKYYGFEKDNVKLFLGEKATKAAIESLFSNGLLMDRSLVKEDHCVLVYFAGHGNRESTGEKSRCHLFPYDVKVLRGEGDSVKGIDYASCLRLDHLVTDMKDCDARHKLLVLDSCHSGEIFKTVATRSTGAYQVQPDLFKGQAFHALTSTRGSQRAVDGSNDNHSPFTGALLETLTSGISASEFDTTALHGGILERMAAKGVNQNPMFGTLTGGDGDFYFFRTSTLAPAKVGPNYVLQTLPGLNGKWWFDESPWLIPSLRADATLKLDLPQEVAVSKPTPDGQTVVGDAQSSGLHAPRTADVYARLFRAVERSMNSRPYQERKAFVQLQSLGSLSTDDAARKALMAECESLQDPHLTALLHHKFRLEGVEKLYELAIDHYSKSLQEAASGSQQLAATGLKSGLLRLCYSDLARYYYDTSAYSNAAGMFRQARGNTDVPTADCPPLFFVHCLVWESAAHARLSAWSAAEQSLERAQTVAELHLPRGHALAAVIQNQRAWNAMDQWRLADGRKSFESAIELWKLNGASDVASTLALCHARHGLAMVERFQARFDEARTQYNDLRDELISIHEGQADQSERSLIAERLVNTLERLGDCYLFSVPQDAIQAQDAYQHAIDLSDQLSHQLRVKTRVRLLYKQAMSLSDLDDAASAAGLLEQAQNNEFAVLTTEERKEVDIFKTVAEGISALGGEKANEGRSSLRTLIRTSLSTNSTLGRQQFEVLLYGGSHLLAKRSDDKSAADDASMLFRLVPDEFINPSVASYLRPYYDEALATMLVSSPRWKLPSYVRYVLKAKTGEALTAPPTKEPFLVFFLQADSGFALLTAPSGAMKQPQLFTLPFGQNTLASAKLPDDLVKAASEFNDKLVIHWTDASLAKPLGADSFPFAAQLPGKLSGQSASK